jgi:hypothetical protein
MEMFWVMGLFFAFITIVFIAVAYFLPEWVGITGQKALEVEKHQQNSNEEKPPPQT